MRTLAILLAFGLLAGSALAETPKPKAKRGSAAAGASAPAQAETEEQARERAMRDLAFRSYDIDGDGLVSKAEAAGHEDLVVGFDRADRDRDGKLSRKEYDALLARKARLAARAAERQANASASTGASKASRAKTAP